jgi:Protein of unknown function (DUF2510)
MGTRVPPAVVLALAGAVGDFVGKLERDLGVDGTELTVLFGLVVGALIVLLLMGNRAAKKKALRVAHAGRFVAADPFARSFHLQRSVRVEPVPDPVTHGPARDPSNPRYRPETLLPDVPDPAFPTLENNRVAALAIEEASLSLESPSAFSSPIGVVPVGSGPIGANPLGAGPLGAGPLGAGAGPLGAGAGPLGANPLGASPSGPPGFSGPSGPSSNGSVPGIVSTGEHRITLGVEPGTPTDSGGVAVATAAPLVGWYEDPDGTPGSLRYWDGQAWTARRLA